MLPGASYDDIEALASSAPAGASGVLFTPWLTGERSPVDDKHARAGFHNVSLTTTRADLARAVLEGVAHNLRWLLDGAERFTRTRLDPMRVLGGAARMDLWCQVVADVLDRSLERVDQPLVGGLRGAGLYAGLAWATYAPTSCASSCPSTASSRRTRRTARPTTGSPESCRASTAARSGCLPGSTADIRTSD